MDTYIRGNDMNTNKEFIATWTADEYVHPEKKVVSMDFFTEDNGYDAGCVRDIDALLVGEILTLGIGHTLRRVR